MLLPGAIYVIGFFISMVGVGICMLAGTTLGYALASLYKYFHNDKWRINLRDKLWFKFGFVFGFLVTAYCIAGPIVTLIQYLKGV